ncbi:hypothetical protein [Limisphaera ngatamarikiensis]|uniref:hypothetical protein n=1 Tax=Limisphaera ngatamarikiensis TaxID=1324935 RepID=UPI00197DD7B1|nr:hypothetical protein [Limisphaera ngatamarikiensis]
MDLNHRETRIALVAIAALVFCMGQQPAQGIEGLTLQVQGTNVVLSWPSTENETFIVRYRARLDEAHPWTILTNNYPAALGTNRTVFTHVGVVEYGQTGAGGAGGDQPFPPHGASANQNEYETFRGDDPSVPPLPWDPRWLKDPSDGSNGPLTEGANGEVPLGAIGFYQVVRQGVHFIGLTNGMLLSGVVGLPIEVGYPEGELLHVTIMIDDYGTEAARMLTPPFPNPLHFVLDTRLLSNGVHTLQAEATWMVDPSNADPAALVHIASPVVEIEVFNEISFPNWSFHFGELYDSMLINAVSAHPVVDWEIAIFDSQNRYVGSFFGRTTNGQIRAVWNLIDPFGVRRTDPWFDADIYTWWDGGEAAARAPGSKAEARMIYGSRSGDGVSQESGGGAATTTPKKFLSSDRWTGPGNWVVVNQQAWNHLIDHELLDQMTDNFVLAAETRGYVVRPDHPTGEAYRLRTSPLDTEINDWLKLRLALIHPTSRNFYYFGHGGRDQIGYGTNDLTRITTAQLYRALATGNPLSTNRHAYRFVFLDGCETAKGDLPLAFGIPKKTMTLEDFADDGRRPCAFMGWTATKWMGILNRVWYDHINWVTWFEYEWVVRGKGLRTAAKDAAGYAGASGINLSNLKIYGYDQLGYNEFNNAP